MSVVLGHVDAWRAARLTRLEGAVRNNQRPLPLRTRVLPPRSSTVERSSTITFAPFCNAASAAVSPAAPQPTITTSQLSSRIRSPCRRPVDDLRAAYPKHLRAQHIKGND